MGFNDDMARSIETLIKKLLAEKILRPSLAEHAEFAEKDIFFG